MQFANPIWLWGLTGLMVPIGIHLISRKESRIIRIGSLRHQEASHTKQSVNLRLNELLLLAIRCLLITLLILLLSGLHWDIGNMKRESWLLIDEGMEKETEFLSLEDSLKSKGFKVKYLAEGFPEIYSKVENTKADYWNLIEKIRTIPLENIVVLSYGYTEGFRGKRISTPSNLTWISVSPSPIRFPALAVQSSDDSIRVREAYSSADETIFKTVSHAGTLFQRTFTLGNDSVLVTPSDTIHITFVLDPEFNYDGQILEASLRAIESMVPVVLEVNHLQTDNVSSIDQKVGWLIWLSRKAIPSSIATNCILFSELNSTNKDALDRKEISGKMEWVITKRLNEDVALSENLPLKLASALLSKQVIEEKVNALDRRTLPENVLWSNAETPAGKNTASITTGVTSQFLVILIFISLLAERVIAVRRNQ